MITIEDYLSKIGIDFKWDKVIKAPYREDNKPSFKCFRETNTWHDFSTGKSGNLVELIKLCQNVDTKSAYDVIHSLKGNESVSLKREVKESSPKKRVNKNKILEIKSLFSYPLKSYLLSRGITHKVHAIVKEAKYQYVNKEGVKKLWFSIIWKDVDGNIHQRNKFMKGLLYQEPSASGTTFSVFHHKAHNKRAIVFEGYFDYLSHVDKIGKIKGVTYIVLNSTTNLTKLIKYIKEKNYSLKFSWALDNDEAGDTAIKKAIDALGGKDVRSAYNGHNDYNDYYKALRGVSDAK